MAKPKIDFKQLFMDKGEKITIIAAGVLMVLFLTLGILAVATSASTSENEHSILNKVEDINRKMSSNEEKIDNLDESLMKQLEFPSVSASQFRGTNMFVDIALDNAKRGRPTVLQPDEFQVDLIRAPIYVYHFSSDRSKIYVLKEITKAGPKSVTDLKDRAKTGGAKKPAGGAPAPGPAGFPGGPGGGLPGGGMPTGPGMGERGAGGPGGGFSPQLGGSGSGMGMSGPGMPTGLGGGGPSTGSLTDLGIFPVDIEKFETGKMRPARFLKPVRMIVVSASFPYKKQLEEFKTALRHHTLADLVGQKELPEFLGFNVQRQVKLLDGTTIVQAWSDLDWLENYKPIYSEKDEIDAKDEPKELAEYKIIPAPETQLCLPLPLLARGKYPEIKMQNILNALDRLKTAGTPPKTGALGASDRFKGDVGPFGKPSGAAPTPSTTTGGGKDQGSAEFQDAILLRFVDVNIEPGYSYEYRIQLKMANPNYDKPKDVGRPDDAAVKELTGKYTEVMFTKDGRKMSGIPVPPETFVFASPRVLTPAPRTDHVRLQIQAWTVRVKDATSSSSDEVGDWLVEDLDVARGQYVMGTKNVKLPVWDPKHDHYQFKEMKSGKAGPTAASSTAKGAVPILFAASSTAGTTLLVDFEGGKSQQPFRTKSGDQRTVQDEPGVEVLLMTPEGRLVMRTSAADRNERDRIDREKEWLAWQEETKKTSDSVKPGKNDGFEKPGGTTGSGKGGS